MGGSTSRLQSVLNLATVVLLGLLILAFVLMPRYNYGVMTSRVAALEAKATALESRVAKLNVLGGPDEAKRAAVVGNIEFIARNLQRLDTDLVSFLEHLANATGSVDDLSRRISAVEESLKTREPREMSDLAIEPVALKTSSFEGELAGKASGITPRRLGQMSFEPFLALAVERGLIPSAGEKSLSEESRSRLSQLFASFRSSIETINRRETLYLQELVEKATLAGDYVEEVGDLRSALQSSDRGITLFLQDLGGGRRRLFQLSTGDDPEIARFEALRAEALKSFLALLAAFSGA